MSDLTFTDDIPVTRQKTGGKDSAPNPYDTVVQNIRLAVYTEETTPNPDAIGKPVTKSHIVTHENEDTIATDRGRISRQLTAAGKTHNVTVRRDLSDANELITTGAKKGEVKTYRTKVVFWTVPVYKSNGKLKPRDKNNAQPTTAE